MERAGPRAAHAAGALYRAGNAIPWANHRLSEPGFWSAVRSAFARPGVAGGKGRAHPTICGAERGAYGVERAGPLQASAAGALYRAGGPPLLFPSDPGFLDSYVPTALHLRPPPPGAGGEGGGGPGCVRGRVGRRRGEGVEKAGRLGEGGADRRRVLSSGEGRVCCVF